MTTHHRDEKKPTKVGSDVLAKLRQSVEKIRGDNAKTKSAIANLPPEMQALFSTQGMDEADRDLEEILKKYGA